MDRSTTRAMSGLDWAALILLVIGGLNWGLIGFFGFNLIDALFGAGATLTRIIYALVGLAALYYILVVVWKSST